MATQVVRMASEYVHVELESAQSPKRAGAPCGDVFACDRTVAATSVICCDGIGTGIRACIAAKMCASRLLELLRLGFSLRKAFARVVRTMQQNRDPSRPFAAFTLARILNDGTTNVLSYDAPPAIYVSRHHAAPLPTRSVEMESALVAESDCWLEPGDGLLLDERRRDPGRAGLWTAGRLANGRRRPLREPLPQRRLPSPRNPRYGPQGSPPPLAPGRRRLHGPAGPLPPRTGGQSVLRPAAALPRAIGKPFAASSTPRA